MISYKFRRLVSRLSVCLAVWLVMDRFSPDGRVYAGFAAAFLGAVHLLAGWLSYLKSTGTDVLGRLKRRPTPQAPYFHLRDKAPKPRAGFGHIDHPYDDDLPESVEEQASHIPLHTRHRLDAVVYAAAGLILLALSMI